jgi:hypothetical protein
MQKFQFNAPFITKSIKIIDTSITCYWVLLKVKNHSVVCIKTSTMDGVSEKDAKFDAAGILEGIS